MPVFKSEVPANIAICYNAPLEIIPIGDYQAAIDAVELIKKNASMIGGVGKLDLHKDIAENAYLIAIWKIFREDPKEWHEFLDFLASNRIRQALINQMKRMVEDHFVVILNKTIAYNEAKALSSTREMMVDRFLAADLQADKTHIIRYVGGHRATLSDLVDQIKDETIADDTLIAALQDIINDEGGEKSLHVQKYLGINKVGAIYKIRYIPLPTEEKQ